MITTTAASSASSRFRGFRNCLFRNLSIRLGSGLFFSSFWHDVFPLVIFFNISMHSSFSRDFRKRFRQIKFIYYYIAFFK